MTKLSPIFLVTFLIAAVFLIALPGDPAGLLLLTPALAILLPLLAGAYPGERAASRLASWFARAVAADTAGSNPVELPCLLPRSVRAGFSFADGSRGPPLLTA